MPVRHLPVRPSAEQLKHQAKELLRALRRGDRDALADLAEFRVHRLEPASARLADAQFLLARSYQAPDWPRLMRACALSDAIWRDDAAAVRALVLAHPALLGEPVLVRPSNWGCPLSYAATLGRAQIVQMLHGLGARDVAAALDRATLHGHVDLVRTLHALLGPQRPAPETLGNPAYTLNVAGTAVLFDLGLQLARRDGRLSAPVDVVLETDSRNPEAKHAILEMYVQHGLDLPDTPVMALHRGRLDLLEAQLRQDPGLLRRTFTHEEIYPPSLGCHDEVQATQGTPLAGTTLLHLCADYDELAIATWLLDRGMPVDARAAIDAEGFGGHTALFGTVVSQPAFWINHWGETPRAPFTELLLARGADASLHASLRKELHPGYGNPGVHEYRAVTPRMWGEQFHDARFVNRAALELLANRELATGSP
jgi:hypothetical protein